MVKKMFAGIGFLVVIFIAVMVYMHFDSVKHKNQMNEFKAFRKSLQQVLEADVKPEIETGNIVFSDQKPDDIPGYKWVRHGDHWDKVPVAQTVISNESSNKPLFLEGDDVDITDKDYYIFHVYDKRYAIRRVNQTPEDIAKMQKKIVELKKKAKKMEPGYVELSIQHSQALDQLQEVYAKALKSVEISKQKDKLHAAFKSGEISWEEWSRQIKEIDESPEVIDIKQYVQSIEEVYNEDN